MDIAVIGLGSMGKRRIRQIKQYILADANDKMKWKIIGVDSREDRRNEAEKLYQIETSDSLDEVLKKCDAVIVSTSPESHGGIINSCLKRNKHVFSEINLIDDMYDENIQIAMERGLILFLSSTPIYNKNIQYISQKVGLQKMPLAYIYHVGQYLPDWHPWEGLAEYFISKSKTNGCREIFAIELPWMIKAFGNIVNVKVVSSRNTNLNIEYKNNYQVLITQIQKNGIVNNGIMAIDVMTRKPVHNLEIYNEECYLFWDGTTHGLIDYDVTNNLERQIELYKNVVHQEGYSEHIVENDYYEETKAFLELLLNKENKIGKKEENELYYNFHDDKKTLQWIDKIEE